MSRAGKNILICSDGTGNSYAGPATNVRALFGLAAKDPFRQVVCYDPGVGTLPRATGAFGMARTLRRLNELAFGSGLFENVEQLYRFLMAHYEPGDRVFLFGFSRGAFTVRALAGLLHVCGLLRAEDTHLVPYALGLYQTSEARIRQARAAARVSRHFGADDTDHARADADAARFKTTFGRRCDVHLLGLWDTVKAYGWIVPRSSPALRHNPCVAMVRHAVAILERRTVFQVTTWGERHPDAREVWFAGDHSDVGGGQVLDNPLAAASLLWMLGEATAPEAGLLLDASQRSAYAALCATAARAPSADIHDRQWEGYWLLDYVPLIELDNGVYPPRRRARIGPRGARRPGVPPRGPVWRHASTNSRAGSEGRYAVFDPSPVEDRPIPPEAWV